MTFENELKEEGSSPADSGGKMLSRQGERPCKQGPVVRQVQGDTGAVEKAEWLE